MDRRTLIKAGAIFIFAPKFGSWYKQAIVKPPEDYVKIILDDGSSWLVKANWNGADVLKSVTFPRPDKLPWNSVIRGIEMNYKGARSISLLRKPLAMHPGDVMQFTHYSPIL
jgi:hypothetical protein